MKKLTIPTPQERNAKRGVERAFQLVAPGLQTVEKRVMQQARAFDPGIAPYIEYAASSGGKRLRAGLALLSGMATGGATDKHTDLAVVVELVHLATLVHDDVLDNALLRRSRPTLNAKWGTELSVLLGDCLFAHALQDCTRFEDHTVSRLIAEASNEVCTGEILQTQRRYDLKLSVSDYLRIIRMKTGALFRVSCELGAHLNGARAEVRQALLQYGERLGTAYQIYDDCLDLFGTENGSGKTLGTDVLRGKWTLPLLHLLGGLKPGQEAAVHGALLEEGTPQEALVQRIREAGGDVFALRKARELVEDALGALAVLDPSEAREALQDVGEALLARLHALSR